MKAPNLFQCLFLASVSHTSFLISYFPFLTLFPSLPHLISFISSVSLLSPILTDSLHISFLPLLCWFLFTFSLPFSFFFLKLLSVRERGWDVLILLGCQLALISEKNLPSSILEFLWLEFPPFFWTITLLSHTNANSFYQTNFLDTRIWRKCGAA